MNRRILSAAIIAALAFPTLTIAQGRHRGGQGKQVQASTQSQERLRKRDGTGPNCTGNCPQQQTQAKQQTRQQTQTQQQTEQQTQNQKK